MLLPCRLPLTKNFTSILPFLYEENTQSIEKDLEWAFEPNHYILTPNQANYPLLIKTNIQFSSHPVYYR
ncbi:hypothetical protein [Coxiella-like endosymbiont of Rhipicephalus sanguineus]|uniref:hypothetical protein n=1 Tax=Coxiella-like endosymbiont of Rhipicephalus sanguineus TaxID=1955402 RepID=UPI00203BFA28|nr:hypothetical protein [Coxiella-like endosymbiont of Rhipicephalus sanguineus]